MPYGTRRYHTRRPRRSTKRTARVSRRSRYPRRTRRVYRRRRTGFSKAVAQTHYFKFLYADDTLSVSGVANGVTYKAWRGNSPYDPDYAAGGVQPYGWDNYTGASGLFQIYNVLASSIAIYAHNTTNNLCLRMFLLPFRKDYSTMSYVDPSDLTAVPYVKQLNYNFMDGSQGTKLSNYMSTRRLFPDTNVKDANFSSLYSTNPATSWYWNFIVWSEDATAYDVIFDIKIVYYTIMTRNDDMNES